MTELRTFLKEENILLEEKGPFSLFSLLFVSYEIALQVSDFTFLFKIAM